MNALEHPCDECNARPGEDCGPGCTALVSALNGIEDDAAAVAHDDCHTEPRCGGCAVCLTMQAAACATEAEKAAASGVRSIHEWTFGPWSLTAEKNPETGSVSVYAERPTKRGGTRHGSYLYRPDIGIVTVSMADAKVNAHVRTAMVRRVLDTMADDRVTLALRILDKHLGGTPEPIRAECRCVGCEMGRVLR